MLNNDEKYLLDSIAYNEVAGDPRFARAMSRGRPRAPREYRLRRYEFLPAAAILVGAAVLAVHHAFLFPVVGVIVAAAVVARANARTWQDRPGRRRTA